MNVYKGIQEWKQMRERIENYDISDDEYLEWKLNFMNDTIKFEVNGKAKKMDI